jgi:hypothetical protein
MVDFGGLVLENCKKLKKWMLSLNLLFLLCFDVIRGRYMFAVFDFGGLVIESMQENKMI